MNEAKRTLIDMYIGMGIYVAICEIIGMIIIRQERLFFSLGLVIGIMGAAFLSFHMYLTLSKALDMNGDGATKYVRTRSYVRLGIMVLLIVLGRYISRYCFIAVVIGIFGLKVSAYLQPLINKYISSKIFKEGR